MNRSLVAKRADQNNNITTLENEIDRVVYSLYNLTPKEIAIVEGVAEKTV